MISNLLADMTDRQTDRKTMPLAVMSYLLADVISSDAYQMQYCVHVPRVVISIFLCQYCHLQHLSSESL